VFCTRKLEMSVLRHGTRCGLLVLAWALMLTLVASTLASAASWPTKQRDMCNTGRADFTVPTDRQSSILDVFLWQTPTPGSPNEGNVGATQMTFFDGVGPGGANIVVGGYHWPKGVQGMNRQTGLVYWYGNPEGGESIGGNAPGFSNDGHTIYVTNDATSHPMMAFAASVGPSSYWHNGADPNPGQLSSGSPKIAPDGRIFAHAWNDRTYGGTDSGSAITTTWIAATIPSTCYNQPAIYQDGSVLKVITGGRSNAIVCYNGTTGAVIWSTNTGRGTDMDATVNPSNGNIYVGMGSGSIYVAGLTKDGAALAGWGAVTKQVYDGSGNPENPQSCGCLSHDGATYYFQTNATQGTGKLYAINTSNGTVKWSYATGSTGWEGNSSCPIVTPNGIIIVGNNGGGTYLAIRDDGASGTLLDSLQVESGGTANASASLSPEGLLYLAVRTIWTTPNGAGGLPSQVAANLFTCLDLRSGATTILSPPADQAAVALNHAVALSWTPIPDPNGVFDHYAIYRATSAFTSVQGKTPIATVVPRTTSAYTDSTALNGTHYYYAVTSVSVGGGEWKTINSIGPRTPRSETDLQIMSISRTPFYPRYLPSYSYYWITEPSGFGPYWYGVATGLGGGQTGSTQRWPNIGDTVTYTATVRNRGTNTWSGTLPWKWYWDGQLVESSSASLNIPVNGTYTRTYTHTWDGQHHEVKFMLNTMDARLTNNILTVDTKAAGFLTYVDRSVIEDFREINTPQYPLAYTDDMIDWLNHQTSAFNGYFQTAGSPKRVHYDILQVLNDTDPDPTTDTTPFGVFPFRYYAGSTGGRGGWYDAATDVETGLVHEMSHQLGLIDIYNMNMSAGQNEVSVEGYSAVPCMMNSCSPFFSEFSANGMTLWDNVVHGYYGQFIYNLPATIQLRVLGYNGNPLSGATVKMYQFCERPGIGRRITNQIKAQGTTNGSGIWVLPNVPINPALAPAAYTGDQLHNNPFGYLDVVGTNGVLLFRVEYAGGVDYCWYDVTEAMNAYCEGQTVTATFDRQVSLGGPTQLYAPDDMAELNASDWEAWAEAGSATATDDTVRKVVGNGSVKWNSLDAGFDTSLGYPRTQTAQWDLRLATTLTMHVYVVNDQTFQNGSPWIRLKDSNGNYYQYQYYSNGSPADYLNYAIGSWQTYQIPIYAPDSPQSGWGKIAHGTPDMAHINKLEFHSDTWDYGYSVWVDGVRFVFSSTPAIGIKDVKMAANNTRADISNGIVTAAWPDVFYVESPDRFAGIRVEKAGHGLSPGQSVRVTGFVKTNSDGERTVDASWAAPDAGSGKADPLLMTTRCIGGGSFNYNPSTGAGQKGVLGGTGLNNIGLLVRIGGKVVERDSSPGPTWFKIGDGSSTNVKVIVPSGGTVPALNTFQKVTGASSCYKVGSDLYPQILATQIVPQ